MPLAPHKFINRSDAMQSTHHTAMIYAVAIIIVYALIIYNNHERPNICQVLLVSATALVATRLALEYWMGAKWDRHDDYRKRLMSQGMTSAEAFEKARDVPTE